MRVKPSGSLHAPILWIGSYPPNAPHSTIHHDFGTTDDVSCASTNDLLHKTVYDVVPTPQLPAMTITDWLPVRIDRLEMAKSDPVILAKRAEGKWKNYAPSPLQLVPQEVSKFGPSAPGSSSANQLPVSSSFSDPTLMSVIFNASRTATFPMNYWLSLLCRELIGLLTTVPLRRRLPAGSNE
jgi:hypothetical protein